MPDKRRVAIVDDSAEIRELMEEILHHEGPYEVQQFDGRDTTARDVSRVDPGTVILDLRLDDDAGRGWDLLQEIRAEPSLAAVPIIVCTADAAQLRERGDDLSKMPGIFVLEKPFSLESLENLVDCAMQAAAVRD